MATVNEYDLGDLVRVSATFTNSTGTPTNTTVTLRVRKPDASVTTPTAVSDGSGAYHYDIAVDQPGIWFYRFEGTGAVQAASEAEFTVAKSQFYAPLV